MSSGPTIPVGPFVLWNQLVAHGGIDRRFDAPLSARTQTIFKVILFGFILLAVGYMTICLFWNPPWLP